MAEWQDCMSSHEFAEWMAFARLQPFGEWRDDWRMATLAATIVNVMTRSKESDKTYSAEDFMPDFEKALDQFEEAESIPEHERVWRKVQSVFGAMVTPPTPSAK